MVLIEHPELSLPQAMFLASKKSLVGNGLSYLLTLPLRTNGDVGSMACRVDWVYVASSETMLA